MKKIILSAAIAAICAAPAAAIADAENELYGQMRYSINSVDDENTGKDGLSAEDNVSLFGLKGSAGDDDITAFYHLQTGAPTDDNDGQAFNQRFFFAGLKGAFGKAAYGRMTNAYKFAGFKLDPFYNMSGVNANGKFATGGATYGLSPATNGFTDNAVQYTSPAFSGVKINAGVYIDDSNEDEHGMGAGISWSGSGMNIGLQYAANDTNVATIPGVAADGTAMRVHGGYKGKGYSVAASYEVLDNNTADDPTYLYLTGTFNVSDKTRLVGSVGVVGEGAAGVAGAAPGDPAIIADAEGTGFTLAAFHTIVPKTDVYVQYSAASLDGTDGAGADLEDPSVFTVGAIHKFGFGS
jgi:hypothetical protein